MSIEGKIAARLNKEVSTALDGKTLRNPTLFGKEILALTEEWHKENGYVKLADIRQAVAIEHKKAVAESETTPFQVRNLDYEHKLLWKGHANAYSEVISYLDRLVGGK